MLTAVWARSWPVAWSVFTVSTLLVVVAAAVSLSTSRDGRPDPSWPGVIYVGANPVISIHDLVAQSDAVVVLRATGEKNVHWNSHDGRAWASSDRARPAHIYSDETVVVEQVISGAVRIGPMILRKMGGTADGFWMHFDNDPELVLGEQYLVFLRDYDTPTQTGSERLWTITMMDRGVFAPDGRGWYNPNADLRLSERDVEALATQ